MAAEYGQLTVLKALMSHKADINATDLQVCASLQNRLLISIAYMSADRQKFDQY